MSRFDYVKYDGKATEDSAQFKKLFEEVEAAIVRNLKPGRASGKALDKIEEGFMWIGKAIRDEQLVRNNSFMDKE